jgi:hypothetical protein
MTEKIFIREAIELVGKLPCIHCLVRMFCIESSKLYLDYFTVKQPCESYMEWIHTKDKFITQGTALEILQKVHLIKKEIKMFFKKEKTNANNKGISRTI